MDKNTISNELPEQTNTAANAETAVAPVRTRKKKVFSAVVLVVMGALGIYLMLQLAEIFSNGDKATIQTILKTMDYKYFAFALCVVIFMIAIDSFKYLLISKVSLGKAKYGTALKVSLIGKYYDNITPFAVGGQPFQIYYLNKRGYSGGQSSAIVLIKYFVQMFCWTFIALILMAFNAKALSGLSPSLVITLKVGAWVGFAMNASAPVLILLFLIMPRFAERLVRFIVNIGFKLHIVKDKEKTIHKAHKIVSDFVMCFDIMKKYPAQFILLVILCFVEPLSMLSLPYFLVVSMAKVEPSFALLYTVMTMNMFAMYSVAIFPTPGNSGFFETTFSLIFSAVASNVLFWVTLSWRFLTYYLYIIIGLLITFITFIRDRIRKKQIPAEQTIEQTTNGA